MPGSWTPERMQILLLCMIDDIDSVPREKFDKAAAVLGDGATKESCR